MAGKIRSEQDSTGEGTAAGPVSNAPQSVDQSGQAPSGTHVAHSHLDPDLERRDLLTSRRSSRYVRIVQPHARAFVRHQPGHLIATERAAPPGGPAQTLLRQTKRLLIGTPISTAAQESERLTKVKGLAVLSSDAISSVAYATEASMAVLITAGLAALSTNLILAACIATVMVIVGLSYRQTIHAYPNGGGSYIVARDNLGDIPGLVAAAALLIDYVLTVSVSVASGVDYLISALPALAPFAVLLGVLFIGVIALVNLRGVRESGSIFAAPTYFFIGTFLIMIVVGIIRAALQGGVLAAVPPTIPPAQLGWAPARLSLLLILSAFAQGCSAMTGTEAISNGVLAFKRPEAKNAARTLEWMVATLFTLFLGTTYLAWRLGVEPNVNQQPTLNHQIAQHVFTGSFSWFVYVLDFATLIILVLAANTSFADFPRLSSILARDGFVPRWFRLRGDRLAFSTGIIVLAVLSGALLAVYQGNVNDLINLYALGVFTAFTLSQAGMVVRWLRHREQAGRRWRWAFAANLVGAAATALVGGIIAITKFDKGAWIIVVLVPLLVITFRGISIHYTRLSKEMEPLTPLRAEHVRHVMLVPISGLSWPAIQALTYARSITPNVTAVHVAASEADAERVRAEWDHWVETTAEQRAAQARRLRRHWAVWGEQAIHEAEESMSGPPELVVLEATRGRVLRPLLDYFDLIRSGQPGATITVTIPELVRRRWWQRVLPTNVALRLKLALLFRPGFAVTDVPYHLQRTALADQRIEHLAVVPVGELSRAALQSLTYARSITPEFIAVHVAIDEGDAERLRADWDRWVEAKAGAREVAAQRVRERASAWGEVRVAEAESALRRPPQLVVIDSPYRSLLSPLLAYIDALRTERPDTTVTVILPEFVTAHWWEFLLHNQTAQRLKWALLSRPGVVVTDVPYHLPR